MLEEGFIRAEQKKFLRVAATSEGILRLLKNMDEHSPCFYLDAAGALTSAAITKRHN